MRAPGARVDPGPRCNAPGRSGTSPMHAPARRPRHGDPLRHDRDVTPAPGTRQERAHRSHSGRVGMARHGMQSIPRGAVGVGATVLLVLAGSGITLDAQGAAACSGRSALKGIWEPVSYPEDVELNGVFFVNSDVGWVTSGTVHEG